jgi:peptide/nickel transport system permease protein
MSDLTIDFSEQVERAVEVPISWGRRVVLDTVQPLGVRLGLTWIGLVALGAIFAPLLANSLPLLMKTNGKWSSPMLTNLTSVDWILFTLPIQLIVLWSVGNRLSLGRKTLAMIVCTSALTALLTLLVPARNKPDYEAYRPMESSHQIQSSIYAPIRFSPVDHETDRFNVDAPPPLAPSSEHWFGTEGDNEDLLAVMIHACRIAMAIGFISTGISVVIGIIIGSLMGYFAGTVDLLGMRLVEIFSSIPQIYLLIAFCAAFERNIYLVMIIIGLTSWPGNARFVRAEFLKLRNQDFVHAAIAAGLPLRSVLFRHILPNALAPLLVIAGFGVASAILNESILSFIGLGLPLDAASWGRLLNQAVSGSGFFWWLAIYPGLAIFLTVFAYNRVGEALRDALDPKLLKR